MKKLFVLIIAIFCGALASQFPEYAQQYRQRLAGAVGELERVVRQFDTDARASGLTRDEALSRYSGANDEFLKERGSSMVDIIARFNRLDAHLAEMNRAGDAARLWVFAKSHDRGLAKGTLDIYQPAIPVTPVGLAHAAGGFAGAWLLLSLLLSPFGRRKQAARGTA